MISLNAKYIPGGGGASGNLKSQLPLIAKEFPEVAGCFHGTINLQLECQLLLLSPDHRTQPIKWSETDAPEVFDFLRMKIEAPANTAPVPAWLYVAHHSPWRQTPHIHEVIAMKLPVETGMPCRIHIDRPCCVLPYMSHTIFI